MPAEKDQEEGDARSNGYPGRHGQALYTLTRPPATGVVGKHERPHGTSRPGGRLIYLEDYLNDGRKKLKGQLPDNLRKAPNSIP